MDYENERKRTEYGKSLNIRQHDVCALLQACTTYIDFKFYKNDK